MSILIEKRYNPFVQFVRGIRDDMPAFIDHNFGDYLVKVTPNDPTRRFLRDIVWRRYDILPYFYGAYIYFDLSLRIWNKRQLRNKLKNDTITYEWRLCSKDGKEVYHSDIGSSQYNKIVPFNKANTGDVYKEWKVPVVIFRKVKAIQLGLISVTGQYKLIMNFVDSMGNTSGDMTMAEFTVKDRDDFYVGVIWPVLITAAMTVVGGFIGWMLRGGR